MMYTTQSKLVAGSRKTGTEDRTRSVVLLTLAFGAALAALIALATTA